MKWFDNGIILSLKTFTENQCRVSILTENHGRQSGLIRTQKRHGLFQIGDYVHASWNARLEEHLGRFQLERLDSPAPRMFRDGWRLLLLQHMCGLSENLPDRHPYTYFFHCLKTFIETLCTCDISIAFALTTIMERNLLAELGFGIDLSECCVTQTVNELAYISPKTGRAVSRAAGQSFHDKLLRLPSFWKSIELESANELLPSTILCWQDIWNAFHVTAYFWNKWFFEGKRSFPTIRHTIIQKCEHHMRCDIKAI